MSLGKRDLVEQVQVDCGLSRREADQVVDLFLEGVVESLQKGTGSEFRGFGSFRVRQREGRVGRNPRTGDPVQVPPKKVAYFKIGKALREALYHEG